MTKDLSQFPEWIAPGALSGEIGRHVPVTHEGVVIGDAWVYEISDGSGGWHVRIHHATVRRLGDDGDLQIEGAP